MKSEAEMLMKILISGGTVEDHGEIYGMSDRNRLGIIQGDFVLEMDCDISAFVAMAERIGRDELWLKLCAMSLKEHR